MNNDLISREALIEWIDDSVSQYGHTYSTDMLNMWGLFKDYLINKAPTVEPLERIGSICEENCGYRPQGKWIFLKANEEQTDGYECSACKATYHTRVPYFSEFNFCPNCGAKMRKGGAE